MPAIEKTEEEVVSVEALDASLNDLLKATDTKAVKENLDSLLKGGVEHSGHYTEGGTKGGGQAGYSDAGGIDDMMIAKMVAFGVPTNTAAAFAAFMAGKADEEEGEEEEELEGYQKSEGHADDFRKDTDLADYIDASPYMASMTEKTTQALDGLSDALTKSGARQGVVNERMGKALFQVGQLLKSRDSVIEELGRRLGVVESTPNAPKGQTGAAPLNKSMPGEATHGGDGSNAAPTGNTGAPIESMKKSEVVATMSYMRFNHGHSAFAGQGATEAIALAEATGDLSKGARKEINDFLVANPNELQAARSYA